MYLLGTTHNLIIRKRKGPKLKLVTTHPKAKALLPWLKNKESAFLQPIQRKSLNLKQTCELIQDILKQKKRFDASCRQTGTQRESMEQFTYSYFKHRFGLSKIYISLFL